MKTSFAHLPTDKQQELSAVLDAILQVAKPVMVILFGSYSRGDWVDDRYVENGITYEYKSDFDILIVLKEEKRIPPSLTKGIKHKIGRRADGFTPLGLIFHGIDFLNMELEEGNYFFADIVKEGTMLYDDGQFQLSKAKLLSPKERAKKAQMYFDKWFDSANKFLRAFNLCLNDDLPNQAIFLLHQATESYYMAILLVFNDYKPKLHEIDLLGKSAEMADVRFKVVFPRKTLEESRLFSLLKRAYIDSRYKMGYSVTKEDLEYLSERVIKLKELTQLICQERIAQLTSE
ncbi:HEPN domain-containing protein [Pseudarcicella hirudinis]|uniref:HEPN domain-containing protein n=1 Tax=Pseudarcicella hirudinis TaxID=1079859 RepID=A0A1I5QQR9_9BACT|nr:HEPN domain-containing protein [Pseudarcicella hirudinis]SFP48634.1 HEPN domain-containing protein [Pseudarcicella hirudinis]